MNAAIAFRAHRPGKKKVAQALVQLWLKAAAADERVISDETFSTAESGSATKNVTVKSVSNAAVGTTAGAITVNTAKAIGPSEEKTRNIKSGAGQRRGRT